MKWLRVLALAAMAWGCADEADPIPASYDVGGAAGGEADMGGTAGGGGVAGGGGTAGVSGG
ncbi:hypothetical protein KKF91_12075, partial [Myxococcota bacterium]|nr:hypothetical protein [Myxococcota bacterium]